jgi:hypothetical protein
VVPLRGMRPALAFVLWGSIVVLAGCPRKGSERVDRATAGDGLSVAIYTGIAAVEADRRAVVVDAVAEGVVGSTADGNQRRSVALVDDRRTVEVGRDGAVVLSDVAEGIELASLIVEPLDGDRLVVESCARELGRGYGGQHRMTVTFADGVAVTGRVEVPSERDGLWVIEDDDGRTHFVRGDPVQISIIGGAGLGVRCQVSGAAGTRRVRLAYATDDLSWKAAYRVDAEIDDAGAATVTVQPTFTIAGSGVVGARRAVVSLLVGLPGADAAPRLAWRGPVDLGTDEVAVQAPAITMAARLEHIYRGAVAHREDNPRIGYSWRQSMTADVWASLGFAPASLDDAGDLPGGTALVTVRHAGDAQPRQAQVRWPEPRDDRKHGIDLLLWPSHELHGHRARETVYEDGRRLVEQYLLSVGNQSDRTVTVWVEEELRTGAARRTVRKVWPSKPKRRGDLLRFAVTVKPRKTERLGFEAEYTW